MGRIVRGGCATVLVLLSAMASWHQSSWADVSVNVPLDHWSYRFVERCETKGLVSGVGDGIKPFSRLEVAEVLTQVDSVARSGDGRGMALTRIEVEELALLMLELQTELLRDRSSPRAQQKAASCCLAVTWISV